MSVYEKLSKVQNELKAPKSQYNSFGKYNYRNAEDILEAVKPICAKYGAVATLTDEIVFIGERYYVKATARFTDVENGFIHEVSAYAREEESKKGMDGSQVTGASSSYARKYALNGLFAIDDTKDSDTTNKGDNGDKQPENGAKKQQPHKPSDDLPFPEIKPTGGAQGREKIIKTILGNNEEYVERLRSKMATMYGKENFDDLNDTQFKTISGMANDFAKMKGL